jgi:hypothetical protein
MNSLDNYIYPKVYYSFITVKPVRSNIVSHKVELKCKVRVKCKETDKWYFNTIIKTMEFSDTDSENIAKNISEIYQQFHSEVYLMKLFAIRNSTLVDGYGFKIDQPFDEDQSSEEDRIKNLLSYRFKYGSRE